jgi:RND family efflux transporter MFP subunit
MRKGKIIGVLLLCLALAGSIACNPFGGDEEEASQQLVEVVRGDLAISVSGSGNIEVSDEGKLAFGVGGRIDRIYVEEGDSVTKGDVLASLDTDDLELALTQAKVALTQAEIAVGTANVTLRTARHSLDEAQDIYTWPEIKVAEADVDDAEAFLEYVLEKGLPTTTVAYAQARLDAAEAVLDAMIYDYDTEEVAIKKMEVAVAEQSLELSQLSLEQAQQSLEYAQEQLGEATITAPFDGVIAKIYNEEEDVIPPPALASQVIIYLVDLSTMELNVEVDEIDIPEVEPGQRAIINVDALPGVEFEGEVFTISPVAKEEAGVILYDVKVGFNVPEGSGLKVGMSAEADIVLVGRSDVLLVPSRAITEDSEGNPIVMVVVNGQTEERRVVVGVSDGIDTEIVSGLSEGEVVVIER